MAEVMTINQIVQLGVEGTPGVAPGGGSNKLLTGLKIQLDPDFGHTEYAAMGQRFDTVSVPTMEKSKLKGDGPMTYTEKIYVASGVYGAATITTPAGGVNARQWVWAPALSGVIAGQTYQLQQGGSVRARQVNYATFTDATDNVTRKECKTSVGGFAQRIQDGISLTASPTAVSLVPVMPEDWNVYLDYTSAQIGQTKLTRCFAANYGITGMYGDVWPLDRSQPSFAVTVNQKPALALDLSLLADSSLTALWAQARAAGKVYVRYEAVSALLADNYQTLSISGTPTGGTFTLTYKGQTTAAIAFGATASAVQTALVALSTIGAGNVTCSGGPLPGSAVTISFTGALANDTTLLTHTDSFTGGTSPAAALSATTVPYKFVRDMCCVPLPDAYNDDSGEWVQDWKFALVSDPTWVAGNASGTAVMETLVTSLSAL